MRSRSPTPTLAAASPTASCCTAWTQCVPCIPCFDQALPYFDRRVLLQLLPGLGAILSYLVHDAFIAQMSLPVLNSTATLLCFTSSPGTTPDVPKLVLHFDGATLDLPRTRVSASAACLAVNPRGDITIIGNYQQQYMHVLYDLANNMFFFFR
ncbi:hypothetical protein EJB05_06863, partial [Eragrostis curvula]